MGAEIGSFAHHTVTVRMPDIAARVITENDFPPEINDRIESLISEISTGTIRLLDDPSAPDAAGWNAAILHYLGLDWLHVPWFFAETYMYRRIIEATRYYQPGVTFHTDPYLQQKRMGLNTAQQGIAALWRQVDEWVRDHQFLPSHLQTLLKADLWGNQADLSVFPAGKEGQPAHDSSSNTQDQLLVDNSRQVTEVLFHRAPVNRVDLVLDNAGFELTGDLALAYFLLSGNLAEIVRLHVKFHPTFVSDTIAEDVHSTLEFLSSNNETFPMVEGLRHLLKQNKLQITTHMFWTSPLPAWQLPPDLRDDFSNSNLVIFKGDANYRRLLGDLHWPFTTPFSDIVRYFPTPLLALRALKSEIAVGLAPDQPERLFDVDPKWLVDGRWGLLQYAA
jgi:uncharacterized protein with ATP-grasp and redox domains